MQKRILLPATDLKKPLSGPDLRVWRKKLAWTQADAADWLGVTLKAYQNWEQEKRRMRHPVAMRRLMLQAASNKRSRAI